MKKGMQFVSAAVYFGALALAGYAVYALAYPFCLLASSLSLVVATMAAYNFCDMRE